METKVPGILVVGGEIDGYCATEEGNWFGGGGHGAHCGVCS